MDENSIVKMQSRLTTALIALFLAMTLAVLSAQVVKIMRDTANSIDDQRAISAVRESIAGVKLQIAGTAHDNAVWDDAFYAVSQEAPQEWIYAHWGRMSEDHPLYDGVVVSASDGSMTSGYWKGRTFDPLATLGKHLIEQIKQAQSRKGAVTSFFRYGDGVVLIASQVIQPLSRQEPAPDDHVLSLIKMMSPSAVASIAGEHQLNELSVTFEQNQDFLQVPLDGISGKPVAYLSWSSYSPGTKVFRQIYPYLVATAIVLTLFVVVVLITTGLETQRLYKVAATSRYQATHDSLTGLLNRLGFDEELRRYLNRKGNGLPLTVHLIDLDRFKPVNDAWGHAVGDLLLKEVAGVIMSSHPEIVAAARLGGDEFAAIQIGSENPVRAAKRMIAALAQPFLVDGRTIEIGASSGIAHESDVFDPGELIRRADLALYQAKADGRGQSVVYDLSMEAERIAAAAIEEQLRSALKEEAVHVVFQPIVSSATRTITGVEALARWPSSNGEIRPDIFIPIAEKSGLIDILGMQILRKAIQSAQEWPALSLSVNVSPVQLCNPHFAQAVAEVLTKENFDPKRLVLEITEGVLISNPKEAKRSITALRTKGISFALDDFGCGYASIGALREFSFDRIKIDRSLIREAELSSNGTDVLKATVSLAAAMGIPVTAEGVESLSQAQMLTDIGCNQMQGFGLGRPMNARDMTRLLAQRQAA